MNLTEKMAVAKVSAVRGDVRDEDQAIIKKIYF